MNLGDGQKFLQLIPAETFRELCLKHEVYRKARSFEPWDHLKCLVLAQVLGLKSLRDIEATLGVRRSTLCDANADRASALFEDLTHEVFQLILSQNKKMRKAYRRILALDSTECSLHGRLKKIPFFRSHSSASMKAHIVWNVDDEWIEDFRITAGKVNDQTLAKRLKLAPGAVYVFDRAYADLGFWNEIMRAGSHFVTRLKMTTELRIDHLFRYPRTFQNKEGVLLDQEYRPSKNRLKKHPQISKEIKLRHIVYRDPETKRIFDFVTSDFESSAQRIADIYKARWSVELLFRWLKQHLQLREPPQRNRNAIEIHMAISLLIRLLVELFRRQTQLQGTAHEALRFITATLLRQGLANTGSAPPPTFEPAPELRLTA